MPKPALLWYVHVDRGAIDSNRKRFKEDPAAEMLPPVTIKRGKSGKSVKCFEFRLPAGAEGIYTPENGVPILPCGARLVLVSPVQPEVIR